MAGPVANASHSRPLGIRVFSVMQRLEHRIYLPRLRGVGRLGSQRVRRVWRARQIRSIQRLLRTGIRAACAGRHYLIIKFLRSDLAWRSMHWPESPSPKAADATAVLHRPQTRSRASGPLLDGRFHPDQVHTRPRYGAGRPASIFRSPETAFGSSAVWYAGVAAVCGANAPLGLAQALRAAVRCLCSPLAAPHTAQEG